MYYMCIFAICFGVLRKHLGFNFLLTQMLFIFPLYIFGTKKWGFPFILKNVAAFNKLFFPHFRSQLSTLMTVSCGRSQWDKRAPRKDRSERYVAAALLSCFFPGLFLQDVFYIKHLSLIFAFEAFAEVKRITHCGGFIPRHWHGHFS